MAERQPRRFKGIWVPAKLWRDTSLTLAQRVILAEIESLDNPPEHCYAGNEHFVEIFGLSNATVAAAIAELKNRGLVVQVRFDGRTRVLRSTRETPRAVSIGLSYDPNGHPLRLPRLRHRQFRKMLIDRHGGKCESCGVVRPQWDMHLHHKDGAVRGGRNRHGERTEQREHPERFSLLCTTCHGVAHRGDPNKGGRRTDA